MKTKHKPKPVRLDADAAGIVCGLADTTGKSETYIASTLIKHAASAVCTGANMTAVKTHLDALAHVRTVERIQNAKVAQAKKSVPKLPAK